jgi:hypothetical protein
VGAVKEVYDRPFRPEAASKLIDESREITNAKEAAGSSEGSKDRASSRRKGWFSKKE